MFNIKWDNLNKYLIITIDNNYKPFLDNSLFNDFFLVAGFK